MALGIMRRIADPTRRSIDMRLLDERTGIPEHRLEADPQDLPADARRRTSRPTKRGKRLAIE